MIRVVVVFAVSSYDFSGLFRLFTVGFIVGLGFGICLVFSLSLYIYRERDFERFLRGSCRALFGLETCLPRCRSHAHVGFLRSDLTLLRIAVLLPPGHPSHDACAQALRLR